jgi:hypothetical protein
MSCDSVGSLSGKVCALQHLVFIGLLESKNIRYSLRLSQSFVAPLLWSSAKVRYMTTVFVFFDDYVVRRSYVDIETTRQGAEAMRLLLERDPRPDGVFCFNDPLAIGAMSTILEAGLRIPETLR